MKFSAVAALLTAPLALAGVLEADVLPRSGLRRGQPAKQVHAVNAVGGTATTVIIIWVNQGAAAPTQTINPTQVAPAATHTVSKHSTNAGHPILTSTQGYRWWPRRTRLHTRADQRPSRRSCYLRVLVEEPHCFSVSFR